MRVEGDIRRTMIWIEEQIARIVDIGRTLGIEFDAMTKIVNDIRKACLLGNKKVSKDVDMIIEIF